jgi:uncharacterized protein (DUF433 family)
MELLTDRIIIDSNICNGKPVIRGKRITVQSILEFLSAGDSTEELLSQFPTLEKEDISACIKFAAQLMNHQFSIKAIA